MTLCKKALERRVSVMIFPEGTRSEKNDMRPFKDGAFRLAIEAQVPVLPLVVQGTRQALRKHDWRFGHANAQVKVLEPVPTEGMTVEDTEVLSETLEEVRCRWCGATGTVEMVPRPAAEEESATPKG
jgi:1-acyl-sn-glycerol-3-phosphate acyltransferase